jgi:hypothetical protein
VRNWVGWSARGCEILAAATVLLILTQMHTAIVQNALTMVGARTDVPLIVGINDNCKIQFMAPAWRGSQTGAFSVKVCREEIWVTATSPPGQPPVLLVNDALIRPMIQPPGEPFAIFQTRRLRQGVNALMLLDSNQSFDFPAIALSRLGDIDPGKPEPAHWSTFWVDVPVLEPSRQARVIVSTQPQPEQRREGPFSFANGSKWLLVQGRPGDPVADQPGGPGIGPDGFAIVILTPNSPQSEAGDPVWRRELMLKRSRKDQVDELQASLIACLAPDHQLVAWSRAGLIEAPELIMRLTGIKLGESSRIADALGRERHPVVVEAQQDEPACVRLEAQYGVSNGYAVQAGGNSFLMLKRDQLVFEGPSSDLQLLGRPPDERVAGRMVWHGKADFDQQQPMLQLTSSSRTEPAPVRATPEEPQVTNERHQNMLDRWQNLFDALPNVFQQIMWGIAVAAPVALICWALGRHRADSPQPKRIDQARAGLFALLAFMSALALHPALLRLSQSVVNLADLWPFVADDARTRILSVSFAPIAFVVILVILRVLPKYRPSTKRYRPAWPRALAALASLALVLIAIGVSLLNRYIAVEPRDILPTLESLLGLQGLGDDEFVAPMLIVMLVLAWCTLGLLAFWIPVFWLSRSVLRWGPLARTAFFAAILTFFVPLIAPAAELARIVFAGGSPLAAGSRGYNGFGPGFVLLSAVVAATSIVGVVVMVSLTLCGFREIAASMLEPPFRKRVRAWSGTFASIVVAILIIGPTTDAFVNAESANVRLLQLMTTFQAYGALIAILAPLTAMRFIDERRRDSCFKTRFRFDDSIVWLVTAAFAGYLAYWVHEPIGVLILMATGWATFTYVVIDPHPASADEPQPDLAKRLLVYRSELGLIAARRKTVEQEFTDAKIEENDLVEKRAALALQAERAAAALPLTADEAKRRLLGFGPGASPLANGFIGAMAGLIVAALFQIVLPINLTPATGGATAQTSSWLSVLQTLIVDPNYQPVATSDVSPVLALVSELLNAVTIWVLIGFLFGYSFHRIRGSDGFTKAIVFGGGIAVTFFASQAIIAHGAGVPVERLASFLPIFVFLIFLGSLVFDGKSVEKQGVGVAQLPDIYGLKTSIGYASFAGLIATARPLLQFFGGISKK